MQWLAFALRGTDALTNPHTAKEQDEVFAIVISALLQSFLMVVSWVYVIDNCERVAKQLEAAAPQGRSDAEANGTGAPASAQTRRAAPASTCKQRKFPGQAGCECTCTAIYAVAVPLRCPPRLAHAGSS